MNVVHWFARQAAATLYFVLIASVVLEYLSGETGVSLYSKAAAFMAALFMFDTICLGVDIFCRIRAERHTLKVIS